VAAELASPDFVTVVTNVSVFLAASGSVAVAIWGAVKKIKSAIPVDDTSGRATIAGGMLMDRTSMLMWSESNKAVVDELGDLRDEMRELRFVMTQLKDKM
jgi:hypothetical protein